MRPVLSALVLLVSVPALARADEVYLRSGGRLTGVIVEQTPETLVIEAEPGRISLPASYVVRVVTGPTPLAAFRDRAAALAVDDLSGWLELARWAQEREMTTPARHAFERALAVDPGNAVAHRALGHVLVGGLWMTQEDSYRARGFVYFDGTWMPPEEREHLLAERAAALEADRARAEGEARVREAEARARAAEAEARRLEADARQAEAAAEGIPFGVGGFDPFVTAPFGFGGVPFISPVVTPFVPPVVVVKGHRGAHGCRGCERPARRRRIVRHGHVLRGPEPRGGAVAPRAPRPAGVAALPVHRRR